MKQSDKANDDMPWPPIIIIISLSTTKMMHSFGIDQLWKALFVLQ